LLWRLEKHEINKLNKDIIFLKALNKTKEKDPLDPK
jgi:hypothetical protein